MPSQIDYRESLFTHNVFIFLWGIFLTHSAPIEEFAQQIGTNAFSAHLLSTQEIIFVVGK